MSRRAAQILVVDDEDGLREFLAEVLEDEGHGVTQARDGAEASTLLDQRGFHLMLTDLQMPRVDGMTLVRKARAEQPEMEIIVLSAHGSVEGAVEAMRLGAFDYLQKPLKSPAELRLLVERALERRALRDTQERVRPPKEGSTPLTYGDPAMVPVVDSLQRVAPTTATVLLVGESGTGKEVAARAVHAWSKRAEAPFVAINCAALSANLLESELFGHEKGAFTGATAQHRGRLELADGGTFFLDEVGELALPLQAKLLRVVQERRFERVGGTRTLTADVRWIAATNRDLEVEIGAGRFREDLFHRLAVFPVRLPSLRERPGDLVPIAEALLRLVGPELGRPGLSLDDAGRAALRSREWPGNVRELRNTLERAAIMSEGLVLDAGQLAAAPVMAPKPEAGASGPAVTLAEAERAAIERALLAVDGNRKDAAALLEIGVRTLYDKLKLYGIR